jgi:hypothetical protein
MRLSGITDTFAIFAGKVATYRNGSPSHFRFHLHEPSPARPTMAKVVNHTSESIEGIYLSNQSKTPSVSISHLKWKTVLRVLSLSDRKLRITMPRFFNLRRRKQPVVMSYIDEIKDEEVLRVVKHIRNRAGLPALPPNGGPNSSRTMKTEESDDRSVGGKAAGPVEQQPPKEPLALVAEVGSEIQEPPQNGPCSMKAVQTFDPRMLATPNLDIKKASSTRSWVKRVSVNLSASKLQQQEPEQQDLFVKSTRNQKPEKEKAVKQATGWKQQQHARMMVPTIDTSHDGNLDSMDSPTRYLPVTPKTPAAITSYFCTPTLSCSDVQVWSSRSDHHNDERTITTAQTEESTVSSSWTARIRRTEQRIGIAFIDNVLDRIVGDDDTSIDGGTTVMDESTIGPSLIFSPESSKQRLARQNFSPGGTSTAASELLTPATAASYNNNNKNNNRSAHRIIMGKLAKWDEMDKQLVEDDIEDESSTLSGGDDVVDHQRMGEFSETSESGDNSSDCFTIDDEETEMTGGTDYDGTSAYTSSVYTEQ